MKIDKFARLIEMEEVKFKDDSEYSDFSESSNNSGSKDTDESAFYDF